MIEPLLKGEAFLQDVKQARDLGDGFRLWWLGQSGFLLQWQGRHLLIDPYLSDSLTKKYAHTDKPHVRMTELVIKPQRLNFIDVVTSSHNHTDHLDAETLNPLRLANPHLFMIIPEANRLFVAERLQCDPQWPIGLDEGQILHLKEFKITALPAAHEQVDRDEQGRCKYLGYVFQFGPWSIYHSGDCVVYEGLAERLARFHLDLALLPINGRAPERRVPGNMTGPEAAALAKAAGIRAVIPHHYDLFEFNTVTPDAFVQACEGLKVNCRVMKNGEGIDSDDLF